MQQILSEFTEQKTDEMPHLIPCFLTFPKEWDYLQVSPSSH